MGSFNVPRLITEEQKKPLLAEEGDASCSHSVPPPGGESDELPDQPKPGRLASLDVFRGLTVLLMILVDDVGGIIPALNHSPWNGVTIADFVMPFFLFIVGVSLALVYKRVCNKIVATRKASLRALKLIILGIVLQGGYFHGINDLTFGVNVETIRWLGILQRIAMGYFIAALCEIWLTSNTIVDSPLGLLKKYYRQWKGFLKRGAPFRSHCFFTLQIPGLIGSVFAIHVKHFLTLFSSCCSSFSCTSKLIFFSCLVGKEGALVDLGNSFSSRDFHNFFYLTFGVHFLVKSSISPGTKVVAFSLSTLYLGLLYNLYVPDWKFEVQMENSLNTPSIQSYTVKCGVRGNLGPACNAVGMVDRYVLGIEHLYQRPVYQRTKECRVDYLAYTPAWCQAPFDPEGLLSSIMAVVTCFIGLHFGHILVHFKEHSERILHCVIPSLGLIFFGVALRIFGMPLNKPLYTFNYMCVTSGAAGLLFVGIYLLVDLYGYRRPTMLLEWMGMNALTVYVLVASDLFFIAIQGFYWGTPANNIVTYIVQHGPWHHVGALQAPAS